MPSHQPNFRFDFKFEVVEIDKEKGLVTFASFPDPERYEYTEENGKKGYYDKFDNTFFSLGYIEKFAKFLSNNPMQYSPHKIGDVNEYFEERKSEIKNFFEKEDNKSEFKTSKNFLEDYDDLEMTFVILSIDLKDSTNLSQELSSKVNAKIIALFLGEMTLLIDNFNGQILKYTGDGLLAYFPEPNMIGKTDNAINCAYLMRSFVINVINPFLKSKELPELHFRIGLDSGEALITTLGMNGITSSKDLIGETVNLAVKIQEIAEDDQILVGGSVGYYSHTFWRKKLQKIKTPSNWDYIDKATGKIYTIFSLGD